MKTSSEKLKFQMRSWFLHHYTENKIALNSFKKNLLGKSQFKQKYIMLLSLSKVTYANN